MKKIPKHRLLYQILKQAVASFVLIASFLVPGQCAAGIKAAEKLEHLEEVLFLFEIDKIYPDRPDQGYVQVVYPTPIYNAKLKTIARAGAGEEFKVISGQTHYYLVGFEMRGRRYRGYIPKNNGRWSALSAEGRSEFNRILKQHRLVLYRDDYVFVDLVTADNKILQGQALIQEGQEFIRRGETLISQTPIGKGHQSGKKVGGQLIKQGESKVTNGEKLIENGEKMLEKAKEKNERIRGRLSIDMEKAVKAAFEEEDFDEVVLYAVIARALAVDGDILDYEQAAGKAKFYI